MARTGHVPALSMEIVDREAAPTGIGEPPTPVVATALTNVRALPITRSGFSA